MTDRLPHMTVDPDAPGRIVFENIPMGGILAGQRAAAIAQACNAYQAILDGAAIPGRFSDEGPALLDKAWAEINALGGVSLDGCDYDKGLLDAIDRALEIIEKLGGMDPAKRGESNDAST